MRSRGHGALPPPSRRPHVSHLATGRTGAGHVHPPIVALTPCPVVAEMNHRLERDLSTALAATFARVRLAAGDGGTIDHTKYAGAIVDILADPDAMVRRAAVTLFGNLTNTARTLHADAIVGVLADADDDVRHAAVVTLGYLDQATLTLHSGAIVSVLADTSMRVRHAAMVALGKLDQAALTLHAGAIVGMLTDTDLNVHYAAVATLRKVDKAALTLHVGAIVGMLGDSMTRRAAIRLLASVEMGMLAPDVLEPAIVAVTNRLADADFYIRDAATVTLINLKHRRARLHWATARVYRTRPYARFWYEYVVERLCAPGGVWAERDRAAFEAEFV